MQKTVRQNIAFGLELIKVNDYKPTGYSEVEYKSMNYFQKRKNKKADINITIDELLNIVDLKDKANAYPAKLSGGLLMN